MTLQEKQEAIQQAPAWSLVDSFQQTVELIEKKVVSSKDIPAEDFTLLRKELQRREIVYFN